MSEKVRVGVVGAGWPSWQHMKGYQKIDGVEVAALCDLNETRLNKIADEYNVPRRYTSYEEMLANEELAAVSVCTPNKLHADVSLAAMEAGCHVLCEKPMASSSARARRMEETSAKTNRIFMMGYQRRYQAPARYLKDVIERGDLGEIYFVRCWWVRRQGVPGIGGWFTTRELSGGGALIDIGVHVLDLGLWYMGFPEPTGVSGSWGSHFGIHGLGGWGTPTPGQKVTFDVDDFAMAHVTFGKGRSLMLQSSWASHIKADESNVEIWGTKGGARLYPLEIYTTIDGVQQTITTSFRDSNGFDGETAHFVDCIRTGAKPVSPAAEGRQTVELIEKIYSQGETNLS